MIECYEIFEKKLKKLSSELFSSTQVIWCNLVNPNDFELESISKAHNINLDDLKDCLDITERPIFSFDRILNTQHILIRVIESNEIDLKANTSPTKPLGIFISENNKLITISKFNLIQEDFFNFASKTEFFSYLQVLFTLLKYLISKCDKLAFKIALKIDEVQEKILKASKVTAISEPFKLNSYIILFNSAMIDDSRVLKSYYNHNKNNFSDSPIINEIIEDLIIDFEQVASYSSILRDLLANAMDAFASVINNNLSQVMKVVGSISLILMIPTLIASYYGMNIELPFANTGILAFWGIIILSIVLSIFSLIIFRRRNWL